MKHKNELWTKETSGTQAEHMICLPVQGGFLLKLFSPMSLPFFGWEEQGSFSLSLFYFIGSFFPHLSPQLNAPQPCFFSFFLPKDNPSL